MHIQTEAAKILMLLRFRQFDIIVRVLKAHLGESYADEQIKEVQKVFPNNGTFDFALKYKGEMLGVVNHIFDDGKLLIRFLWNSKPEYAPNFEKGGLVTKCADYKREHEPVIIINPKQHQEEVYNTVHNKIMDARVSINLITKKAGINIEEIDNILYKLSMEAPQSAINFFTNKQNKQT